MRRSWRAIVLGVLMLVAGMAPAAARSVDPRDSYVSVQVPGLAPGLSGNAPLYGEIGPNGALLLQAPVSGVRTGNPVYDALIRGGLGRSIVLTAPPPRVIGRSGIVKRLAANATVSVAGRSANVPLVLRTVETQSGTTMTGFFSVPLANYGVRNLRGGNPGPLRVAIRAVFPGR